MDKCMKTLWCTKALVKNQYVYGNYMVVRAVTFDILHLLWHISSLLQLVLCYLHVTIKIEWQRKVLVKCIEVLLSWTPLFPRQELPLFSLSGSASFSTLFLYSNNSPSGHSNKKKNSGPALRLTHDRWTCYSSFLASACLYSCHKEEPTKI